jgi:GNAT superfamily N-acetyltransferase
LSVRREVAVDAALAAQLDAVFDGGGAWNAEQGRRFLADPDALLLVARWDGEECGFLTAYRLQRFDRRRSEVVLFEIGAEEPFRRRGIGRALVEEAKRWAAEVGVALDLREGDMGDLVLDDGATSSRWWATKNEWLGLLDVAGLEPEALYGGFAGEPFGDDSREYVFVARRRPSSDGP